MRAYDDDQRYGDDDADHGDTGERTIDNEVGLLLRAEENRAMCEAREIALTGRVLGG